jgi:fatty acid desaturase
VNPAQLEAFHQEIRSLRRRIDASLGEEDLRHLKKVEGWGRWATVLGLLTAWIAPNPFSAVALSLGRSTRWLLMHHVSHRGYDRVPGVPARYTSKAFAMGWRRWLDWCDWILPEAWAYEHNVLHHSHTGEERDPDLLERNTEPLRNPRVPRWLRLSAIYGLALAWRAVYYAPQTLDVTLAKTSREQPVSRARRHWLLWTRCYLPYPVLFLGILPALFIPLGAWAVFSVFVNSLIADVLTSIHTFIVVGPNHTGDDLYRFDSAPASRAEHYYRQVIGSVNYRTGGDGTDYAHLWLNYQIEHHLFPDVPMFRYQQIQPEVKALCERFGIPYVQQSVWKRLGKLLDIASGVSSMKRLEPVSSEEMPELERSVG